VKVLLWLILSISLAVLSCFVRKFVVRARQKRNRRNFANPKYVIGAAIVNMERAMFYGDEENFRFFARYAFRLCLGMPGVYPPDEPSTVDLEIELRRKNVDGPIAEKILKIYALGALPEDVKIWNDILENTRTIVRGLLANL
jgi:hypothetical protein